MQIWSAMSDRLLGFEEKRYSDTCKARYHLLSTSLYSISFVVAGHKVLNNLQLIISRDFVLTARQILPPESPFVELFATIVDDSSFYD